MGVPENKVIEALEIDDGEISNLLMSVLSSEADEMAVMNLNPGDTEKFMNLLYNVSVEISECPRLQSSNFTVCFDKKAR
jgi:hypothetical protein